MTDAPPAAATDALIERCLAGDEHAWHEIVRRHWRIVFNVAYKFVGRHDLAEDLTQDVFLKLLKSLDTFDRRAQFTAWLTSVSRNLCIDYYRRVRLERQAIAPGVDPAGVTAAAPDRGAHAGLEQRDRVRLLRTALARLPPPLREAVVLRDIQELTYAEIAARLGLAAGTVKSRISRGRAELARQLRALRGEQDARAESGVQA